MNGRRILQHIITRKGQLINNKWLKEFEVPLSNANFKLDITEVPVIHPVVDKILLSEAGEISVAKVSILSGGTFLIFFLGCLACCCCCPCYRECACAACTKIFSATYNGCTTESYRLQKENDKLRKTNKRSRRTLEKSMKEFELVNRALEALGVNVEENFGAQDVENGNLDKVGPSQNDRVSSVDIDGKAVHVGADGKLSNTSV